MTLPFSLPFSLEQESFFGPHPVAAPNIGLHHRLTGPLDAAALSAAASALLARHEGLRFRADPARPAAGQRIAAPEDIRLDPVQVPQERVWDCLERDLQAPLDLTGEGPIRFRLYRTGADAHDIAITVHPAALDAWGAGLVAHELWALYRGLLSGSGADLPGLPLTFSAHVRAQHAAGPVLDGPRLDRHLAQLTGLRLAPLPWTPRPAASGAAGPGPMFSRETFWLDPGTLAGIRAAARELAVTSAASFLAGFELALAIAAGSEAGALSCIYVGRDTAGTQPMAAAMARRVPIRFSCTPGTPLGDFVRHAMIDWASAIAHSGPPYSAARLVQAAGGPLDVIEPVFNLRVPQQMGPNGGQALASEAPGASEASGASWPRVEWPDGPRPRPVPMWPQFGRAALFALVTLGSHPAVTAVYDPQTIPEQAVQAVFGAYEHVIRVLSGDPGRLTVGELAAAVMTAGGQVP